MNIVQRLVVGAVFVAVVASFMGVARMVSVYQKPDHKLQNLLIDKNNTVARAFFSPDDHVSSILKGLIDVEKKRIRTAIYTITDKSIAQAFISAAKRGVEIEFVVDPGYGSERYSQVHQLANAEIGVWSYQASADERQSSLMHNKFCIFDDSVGDRPLVWTGSYNFTKRADERNQENVVIVDNRAIVDRFSKQFDLLKERSLQISGKAQMNNRSIAYTEPSFFKRLRTFLGMF